MTSASEESFSEFGAQTGKRPFAEPVLSEAEGLRVTNIAIASIPPRVDLAGSGMPNLPLDVPRGWSVSYS